MKNGLPTLASPARSSSRLGQPFLEGAAGREEGRLAVVAIDLLASDASGLTHTAAMASQSSSASGGSTPSSSARVMHGGDARLGRPPRHRLVPAGLEHGLAMNSVTGFAGRFGFRMVWNGR